MIFLVSLVEILWFYPKSITMKTKYEWNAELNTQKKKCKHNQKIVITEIKTEIFPSTRKNIPLMKPHQIHTWMGRIGFVNHAIVWLLLVQLHKCSEFPERECCDPIYPSIPELELLPPAQQTTTISSSSSISAGNLGNTGRSGEFTVILHHQRNQSVHRWMCLLHSKRKNKVWFNLIPLERSPVELRYWISISNRKTLLC